MIAALIFRESAISVGVFDPGVADILIHPRRLQPAATRVRAASEIAAQCGLRGADGDSLG
jgi:hypothetical protein